MIIHKELSSNFLSFNGMPYLWRHKGNKIENIETILNDKLLKYQSHEISILKKIPLYFKLNSIRFVLLKYRLKNISYG